MATPFVSGEAALIHSLANSPDPGGVEERIRLGARCVDQNNKAIYSGMLGAGEPDVEASLREVQAHPCVLLTNS